MKRSFGIAAMLVAVAAFTLFSFVPDAFAAPVAPLLTAEPTSVGGVVANVLIAMRLLNNQRGEIVQQAAARLGDIKEGLTPEQVRAIEADHEALLRQVEDIDAEIAALSARSMPPAPTAPANPLQEANAAIAAERARVADIQRIAGEHGIPAEVTARAVNDGSSLEAFRGVVLDTLAERSRQGAGTGARSGVTIEVVRDEGETRREAMAEAIRVRLARASGERVEAPEIARQYQALPLADLAAECIGHRGLMRTAQQVHSVMERAMHTTSDFPAILLDAMNRRLVSRYQAATPSYRSFCARYTVADFRPMNIIRAGDFPSLQEINSSGEIKSGTFSESKEQVVVKPYGVKLAFTRQMIINDQLGAIDQVLSSSGVRVADWENVQAFAVLNANPALLTDNVAVFHTATHGNLASAGTVIDVANVGKARAAMMKQKTLDGILANFTPATLLCGPDKLTEAEQLLTTITPAVAANAVPNSMRRLTPVGDANITGNSWYLFADVAAAPCFVYAYLDGYEGPRMTSENLFDVQGMKVKLEHDFGVAAIDYRGGYRNPGA